jgi:hypothetical protein
MIKKVLNIRQQVVYQNQEFKESYRRVVGGLAWPALPEPGYLVVMGENWVRDDGLNARGLRILAEREAMTIAELHRGCLELRKLCQVESWLTDMAKRQEVNLFLRQNLDLHLRKDVYLAAAAYAQKSPSLGIYAQLILELVQPGRKVLTFGPNSQLNGYLLARTAEEMREPAGKFPRLAALGYGVAEMVIREPWDPMVKRPPAVKTWDRYQWAEGRR